ncbi:flagellar biosynthesis anti-sigma factor FlgM [Oxalobacteraceae bacterium OM1]|nr:flagellar biosynthesis anti-sigma factor FlgM [Oxalobacteraceae bacterium OM1]
MKLDPSLKKTSVGTTQARTGKGAEKAGGAPAPTNTATDSVHLSSQAKLQALVQTTGTSGVFDANKVEEIKAAIAEGRFKVDPEKVAAGLLDTVTDLLHSRKG